MDLPFGRLRMKARGSAGGHNGLRSIIGELGTESFARLRVGIGAGKGGAVQHVLGDFEHAEQRHLDMILDAAADAVGLWASSGPEVVANEWNGWKPDLAAEDAPAAPGERWPRPDAAAAERPEPEGPQPEALEPERPEPDAAGVVRTQTGWRKLLPGILGGRHRDEA